MENNYGFNEMLQSCEQRTAAKFRSNSPDETFDDSYVITEEDHLLCFDFLYEAAALISDAVSYVRNSTQNPLEAISFSCCTDEDPIVGIDVVKGQKLPDCKPTSLKVKIDAVDEKRYHQELTVIQTFIRSAIIHYILYKWYMTKGLKAEASEEFVEHAKFVDNIRFNSIVNVHRKGIRRKARYF